MQKITKRRLTEYIQEQWNQNFFEKQQQQQQYQTKILIMFAIPFNVKDKNITLSWLSKPSEHLEILHAWKDHKHLENASGRFVFPEIEVELEKRYWKNQCITMQQKWRFDVLGIWFPKDLANVIENYLIKPEPIRFPFAVEVVSPPFIDLPEWLQEMWSSVATIVYCQPRQQKDQGIKNAILLRHKLTKTRSGAHSQKEISILNYRY